MPCTWLDDDKLQKVRFGEMQKATPKDSNQFPPQVTQPKGGYEISVDIRCCNEK